MDKKHSSYTQKARKKGKASGGPWRAPRRPSGSAPGQMAAESPDHIIMWESCIVPQTVHDSRPSSPGSRTPQGGGAITKHDAASSGNSCMESWSSTYQPPPTNYQSWTSFLQAPPEHSQEYSSAHQLPPAHTQGWSTYQAPLAHSHVWSSTQPPPSASNQGWSATQPPPSASSQGWSSTSYCPDQPMLPHQAHPEALGHLNRQREWRLHKAALENQERMRKGEPPKKRPAKESYHYECKLCSTQIQANWTLSVTWKMVLPCIRTDA
ncbi:uncharacterized protein LOC130376283 [Gadus chalcogrammus]|uniref:uncharacterized protein LOC130376283 n=1 Tax=Gadus chalcogrammus TaxID=1042646 RepID=UPI0024C28FD1|nr:uncharacterized protein LOC130376283 [Gadus chalcogrammus]